MTTKTILLFIDKKGNKLYNILIRTYYAKFDFIGLCKE